MVTCNNVDCCATRLLWKKIKTSIDEVTNSVTLKDIVEDYKAMKEKNEALKIVSRSEENE